MRRTGVTRFALLSAVAVAATAAVVHVVVRGSLDDRATGPALRTAEVVSGLVVGQLGGQDGWRDLAAGAPVLERMVQATPEVRALEVYDRAGVLAFRSGPPAGGSQAQVAAALAGRTATRELPGGLYEVVLPVPDDGGGLTGAVGVRLDVAAARRDADRDQRVLLWLLSGSLLLLWSLLWWLSASVSRALEQRARAHEQLAATDVLTGLPNRRHLVADLDRAVAGPGGVLVLVDVDRFKEVNDSLGHAVGDQLLREVGRRLRQALPGSSVARLGGDEFAVLLADADALEDACAHGERVRQVLSTPVVLDGVVLDVTLSVGVARWPRDATSSSGLLRCADVAMYASKQAGTGARLYEPELDRHEPDRLALLGDLRRALELGELEVVYQPVYDLLRGGECLAVEALVRWDHPTRGPVSPDEFVALSERSGQVRALTRFVLDEALGRWREWDDSGLGLHLAVNLSARNLLEDDLPEVLAELLSRHGVPAERLILEVTESAFVPEPERAAAVVHRLAGLGANVAIDDFGTGWSSMSRLLEMPLRALKVDRSFVADLPDGPGAALVTATVGLGHDLGLFVVGEGVETVEQLVRLRELGCDVAQGYLLSAAVPSADVPRVAALVCGPAGLEPGSAAGPTASAAGLVPAV